MIFLLPIRTSLKPWRTPYVNYSLIVINVLIFLLTYAWQQVPGALTSLRPWAVQFELTPLRPYLWQFVTYAFLHGSPMHIIGNMFFLYLFGNSVNDKLGSVGYLCFYLAGAVFSGIGHAILHNSPVLGASGAVAAVTGAYLVLFPQTYVTVFYWLFYIMDTFQVSALYFIAFKLILWDNILESRLSNAPIAYHAHLTGYAFGIFAMLSMLALGLIGRSGFDLWSMLKQWNRRRSYRDVVANGYNPFTGRKAAKRIKVKEVKKTTAQQEKEDKIREFCNLISGRISERNLPAAAEEYLELIKLDSEYVIPRQDLLDIANQLASDNKPAESADAYEKFLAHYGSYEYAEQVKLMLGILYSRYLNKPELAVKHLQAAAEKLTDPGQLKMCQDELERLPK
ncbi:MAG: rhomboid family intramembrane serine protease [Planctomycetota bacterium]|jgi:membrane associated rhomboid family serine protease